MLAGQKFRADEEQLLTIYKKQRDIVEEKFAAVLAKLKKKQIPSRCGKHIDTNLSQFSAAQSWLNCTPTAAFYICTWVPCHVGISGNERTIVVKIRGVKSSRPEIPLTLNTACNHIIAAIDYFISKSLKDLSGGSALLQGTIFLHLGRSEASALQPGVTICRHTSTALVWLRMGSAHYVGSPIWTAIT
ncbi:hypothetical protein CDAR_15701 [Caerostris darwini]|uniref:Uncharacterized protein n=1 Tax=Caerostris darwini TaxID=1538125 RepID=A0AAV4Q9T0_9ARAC|nr:hypothetical protein CDAR_15701 [Caerostris darwini]